MCRKKIRMFAVTALTILCMGMAACGGAGTGGDSLSGQTEGTVQSGEAGGSASGEAQPGSEGEAAGGESGESGSGNGAVEAGGAEGGNAESGDGAEDSAQEDIALKDACADYFLLGVGINGSTLDNLTTYDEEYMALVKKHFNSVTMSNLMKSCYILQQKESQSSPDGMPVLDFTSIDDTLQWCMDNGMKMRGHTLVWHAQAPGWFFREGYKDDGDYVDKETMLARMESYIKQMLEHVQENYPGVVYCWDVVNEAVDPDKGDKESFFLCRTENDGEPNPWYMTIGPDYVEAAFRFARKYAAEDVKLFYNDFNTFDVIKRNAICKLCEDLKEKGLIDGIGMQGYWGTDYPEFTTISNAIMRYAKIGVEIQITELSVGVDEETPESFEKQAKRYRSIFLSLRGLDTQGGGDCNITSVTFFGLKDHYVAGDKTNARLFDKDCNPKPAFDAVMEVFRKFYMK